MMAVPRILAQVLAPTATDAAVITPLELVFAFAGGVLIYLALRLIRWAFPLIPLSAERRDRWARVAPLAEVLAWMVYLVSVTAWTLQGFPMERLVALGLIASLVVAALWFLIRDTLSGVVLRTERWVRVGDRVKIGDFEGQIRRFGARLIELELPQGDRVFLPYREIRDATLVLRRTAHETLRHTFTVTLPPGVAPSEAQTAARRAALLSHWIAPGHDPLLRVHDHDRLEITVHALTEVHASDVERGIRDAVESLTT